MALERSLNEACRSLLDPVIPSRAAGRFSLSSYGASSQQTSEDPSLSHQPTRPRCKAPAGLWVSTSGQRKARVGEGFGPCAATNTPPRDGRTCRPSHAHSSNRLRATCTSATPFPSHDLTSAQGCVRREKQRAACVACPLGRYPAVTSISAHHTTSQQVDVHPTRLHVNAPRLRAVASPSAYFRQAVPGYLGERRAHHYPESTGCVVRVALSSRASPSPVRRRLARA